MPCVNKVRGRYGYVCFLPWHYFQLQDIRVFPKLKWMELKTVYKRVQKQQISVVKGDLGRVVSRAWGQNGARVHDH